MGRDCQETSRPQRQCRQELVEWRCQQEEAFRHSSQHYQARLAPHTARPNLPTILCSPILSQPRPERDHSSSDRPRTQQLVHFSPPLTINALRVLSEFHSIPHVRLWVDSFSIPEASRLPSLPSHSASTYPPGSSQLLRALEATTKPHILSSSRYALRLQQERYLAPRDPRTIIAPFRQPDGTQLDTCLDFLASPSVHYKLGVMGSNFVYSSGSMYTFSFCGYLVRSLHLYIWAALYDCLLHHYH